MSGGASENVCFASSRVRDVDHDRAVERKHSPALHRHVRRKERDTDERGHPAIPRGVGAAHGGILGQCRYGAKPRTGAEHASVNGAA